MEQAKHIVRIEKEMGIHMNTYSGAYPFTFRQLIRV